MNNKVNDNFVYSTPINHDEVFFDHVSHDIVGTVGSYPNLFTKTQTKLMVNFVK